MGVQKGNAVDMLSEINTNKTFFNR